MDTAFVFDDALFTYAISSEKIDRFSQRQFMSASGLSVHYTRKTDVLYASEDGAEIAVIGFCVDSHGELKRDEIPGWLLSRRQSPIEELYRACDRFAGKYVIFFFDGNDSFLWGDAICSVQINYGSHDGRVCAAFADKIAADYLGVSVSEYSKKIRLSSDLIQPMPGALTMYDEVKSLLPNHYLNLSAGKAVRVPLKPPAFEGMEKVTARSAELIHAITREYMRYCDIICPLSSGYDSRVVFSFLKAHNPDIHCYTFKHKGFTDTTDDVVVPAAITKAYGRPWKCVPDIPIPEEYQNAVSEVIGPYHTQNSLDLAWTYLSAFAGHTLVGGSVLDEIGKCLTGNATPDGLASPSFLQCKTHNTNPETRKIIRDWIEAARANGEKGHIFDLFAWENTLGRWYAQGSMLYSLTGVLSLNIFNCRELIQEWVSVPRKLRAKRKIHKAFLTLNDPKLLDFPFNPSTKMTTALQSNWVTFYLATYAKQFLLTLKSRR